jgi:hypothetical protein
MERHGSVTMDRPRNIAVGEILSGGMRVLILREGDKLKRMRRSGFHRVMLPEIANHLKGTSRTSTTESGCGL